MNGKEKTEKAEMRVLLEDIFRKHIDITDYPKQQQDLYLSRRDKIVIDLVDWHTSTLKLEMERAVEAERSRIAQGLMKHYGVDYFDLQMQEVRKMIRASKEK